MQNSFEELRQRLDKKERELLSSCDQYLEKHLQEVDSFIRLIQGRCMNLTQTNDAIAETVQKSDEIGLLQFYAGSFVKLQNATMESEIAMIGEIPKQVALKCEIELGSLNKFIEDLQGI